VLVDEFKVLMLDSHTRKAAELAEWQSVVGGYLAEQEAAAKVWLHRLASDVPCMGKCGA
jgi:hypothetical protein